MLAPAPLPASVDEIAQYTVGLAVDRLDTDWAALRLLDDPLRPDGPAVLHRAILWASGVSYERVAPAPPPPPTVLTALRDGLERAGDTAEDPDAPRALRTFGIRSYLAVPVRAPEGGAVRGVLFLNRDRPTPYGENEREAVRLLADIVGGALSQEPRR